ncbi:MAG TPA: hypothetical protein VJ044_07830, partial [Candidatus Hodarchaeales archaeon]|nr:hypothetical protein [Candidatus Hodarchaeales archaeon]
ISRQLVDRTEAERLLLEQARLRRQLKRAIDLYQPEVFFTLIKQVSPEDQFNFTRAILSQAVQRFDQDLIELLVKKELITPTEVTDELLLNQAFELAQAFIESGYAPSQNAEIMAAMNLNLPVLEYLNDIGINPSLDGANQAILAQPSFLQPPKTVLDQIDVLDWYRQQGINPTEGSSSPEILDWLERH